MEPSAVPATGGTTPAVPQSPAGETGGLGGDIFGGGTAPGVQEPQLGTSPAPVPTPGGIFGGTGSTTKLRIPLSNPPTSPLNLIGKLEGWGIGPATPVAEVSIKVSAATGAQLKELLKKLPDGMTFELSLEKEDN